MTLLEDIKSERFIHDHLVKRVVEMVEGVRSRWNKGERIEACILSWPAETIATDTGHPFDGPCLGVLEPVPDKDRPVAIARFAARTKAYALLLIEPKAKVEILAFFESPHGAQEWCVPLERHGDVWVATAPVLRSERRTRDLFQGRRSLN